MGFIQTKFFFDIYESMSTYLPAMINGAWRKNNDERLTRNVCIMRRMMLTFLEYFVESNHTVFYGVKKINQMYIVSINAIILVSS